MTKHEEIEQKVLRKIKPDPSFRVKTEKTVEKIKKELIREVKNHGLPAEVILVGSTAKDTYLKGNMDIDFFILYPTNFSKETIAKETISIAKKILKDTEESYAEHPYLKGFYNDYLVEIVPCYKIEKVSQKLSAVDRTPLHTIYVKENLEETQKDDVRLFKRFLIGINCYGAEAQIQGFSGYLCEILVIKFQSFQNLIRNAKNWSYGKKISIKNDEYPDFDTPLVFIDPVDPERNVSSALSEEKYNLFLKACYEYIEKPSITFFFPNKIKPWSLEKIRKKIVDDENYFVGISFRKPKIIDENLYPQIRKAERSIVESCERNDFIIYDSKYYIDEVDDKIFIILKTDSKEISETFMHMGPPNKLKKNKEEFVNKWENNKKAAGEPFEKEGRIWIKLRRDCTDILDFLENNIEDLSLGKHLDKTVDKNFEVLDQKRLIQDSLKWFWTSYLDERYSWER
jgi:tRNA nucleotidyltransferase (CCA-adding enzyme)